MIYVLVDIACVAYTMIIGATYAFIMRRDPQADIEAIFAALFWPIALPAIIACLTTRVLFAAIDKKHERAAERAAELKQRIAELDEELLRKTEEDMYTPSPKGNALS